MTQKSPVHQLVKAISDEYDRFLKAEGKFSALVDKWQRFQKEHGTDVTPADILQEKAETLAALSDTLAIGQEQEERLSAEERKLIQQQQEVERQLPLLQRDYDQLITLQQEL